MFLNELTHEFVSAISSTHNMVYYFHWQTKMAYYLNHLPQNKTVFSSFRNCFIRRQVWKWTNVYQVHEVIKNDMREEGILFRMDFCEYLQERLSIKGERD